MLNLPPASHTQNRTDTEDQIHTSTPTFPPGLTDYARDFIATLLTKNAQRRPNIGDMLHHGWVEGYRSRRSTRQVAPPQQNGGSAAAAAGPPAAQTSRSATILASPQLQLHNCPPVLALPQQQKQGAAMSPGMPQKAPAVAFNHASYRPAPIPPRQASGVEAAPPAPQQQQCPPLAFSPRVAVLPGPPSRTKLQQMHAQISQRMLRVAAPPVAPPAVAAVPPAPADFPHSNPLDFPSFATASFRHMLLRVCSFLYSFSDSIPFLRYL